jgi:hypothetical protein
MLKATILAAVDPVASQAGRTKTGGRLNVCKALPACSGVAPPPPPPPPPVIGDLSLDPRRVATPSPWEARPATRSPSRPAAASRVSSRSR